MLGRAGDEGFGIGRLIPQSRRGNAPREQRRKKNSRAHMLHVALAFPHFGSHAGYPGPPHSDTGPVTAARNLDATGAQGSENGIRFTGSDSFHDDLAGVK